MSLPLYIDLEGIECLFPDDPVILLQVSAWVLAGMVVVAVVRTYRAGRRV